MLSRLRYIVPAATLAGGTATIVAANSVACKTGQNITTTNKAEGEFDVVIVGGGCGGSAVGSQLLAKDPKLKIAYVEPSETHYCETAIHSSIRSVLVQRAPTCQRAARCVLLGVLTTNHRRSAGLHTSWRRTLEKTSVRTTARGMPAQRNYVG
jgi:2-polyprenyl-6-methoxyphenol hydroxylase-like FAD-dependent oxidoreductase